MGEAVTSPPAKNLVDLVWAFGGRINNDIQLFDNNNSDISSEKDFYNDPTQNTLHLYHVLPESVYSAALGQKFFLKKIPKKNLL